jgi:hypothetical protein
MGTRRRWSSFFVVAGLLAVRLSWASDSPEFREDVIDCDEALAHLRTCCPGFDASKVACEFHHYQGCELPLTIFPAFSIRDSKCILGATCETLTSVEDSVTGSICARAQVQKQVSDDNGHADPYVRVCP